MKPTTDPTKMSTTFVLPRSLREEIAVIEQETGLRLATITRDALSRYVRDYRDQQEEKKTAG